MGYTEPGISRHKEERSVADDITIQKTGKGFSIFSKFPWVLVLIAYMVVVHVTHATMEGAVGYVFIGLGVFVLFIEFFKSGDINAASYLSDIISAVLAVVLATGLMTYLMFKLGEQPTFYHWFGYAIVIGDAIISPFNSFRTALRNFGVGS
jgi:hypothetical protein